MSGIGDLFSGLAGASGLGGLTSLLGGGGATGGLTGALGGIDPNFFAGLTGATDPTGSTGAQFAISPPWDTSGTGMQGVGPGTQTQQQAPQQPYTTMQPQTYTAGPSNQQPDPAVWNIGGTGRSLGPTGFVLQDQGTGLPAWASANQPTTTPETPGFQDPGYSKLSQAMKASATPTDQPTPDQSQQPDQPDQQTTGKAPTDGQQAPQGQSGGQRSPPATQATQGPPQGPPQAQQSPMQGMPNMGRLFRDIQGLMSGSPQSLGSLVQDVLGMAGGQGGQGLPPGLQQMMGMMGGQGMMPGMGQQGGPVATQGPYAGQPISQVPWMSPEQMQQFRQTGQIPGGPARAGQQQGQRPGESYEAYQQRRSAQGGAGGLPNVVQPGQTMTPTPGSTGQAAPPTLAQVRQTRLAGTNTPPTVGYSSYLKQERSQFAEEMKDPNKRLAVAAIASLEHASDPVGPIESLANRAAMTKMSLIDRMFAKNRQGRTFYGPINSGKLRSEMIYLQQSPRELARMNAAIDTVMNGSNILGGATDQGSHNDPNVGWQGGRVMRFNEVYNDWDGAGGHAAAEQYRLNQQKQVRAELQQQQPQSVAMQ